MPAAVAASKQSPDLIWIERFRKAVKAPSGDGRYRAREIRLDVSMEVEIAKQGAQHRHDVLGRTGAVVRRRLQHE
jgi:hypothetical protein